MNIKINGNVITIVSKIDFSDLEDLGPIQILDGNKNPVYAVCTSEIPSISKVGASFTFTNEDENACMNLVTDCMQPCTLRDVFIRDKETELENLMKYEDAIVDALSAKKASFETLKTLVEVG